MGGPYNTHTTADVIVRDLASEITGNIVLTTGVSPGGLGAFFVEHIAAASPALLILAGRNPSKTRATADAVAKINPKVKTRTLQLDLGALKKVREAAAEVNGWASVPRIDVLVNNAAIMARDYATTEDGIESQFAIGHLGPFLFTNLIMKKILASSTPRIVCVSSDGHRLSAIRWPDIGFSVSGSFFAPFHSQSGTLNWGKETMRLWERLNVAYCACHRTANCTINGVPTARPKQRTYLWPPPWPRS